jgi:hypothetical protein
MKKESKPKSKKLLENPEDLKVGITALFKVDEIKMKNLRWSFKIAVTKILPKTYHDYSCRLSLDEEPYDKKIKHEENRIEEIKRDQSLFKDNDRSKIADCNTEIVEIRKEMREMKVTCYPIDFHGQIEALKYKDGDTHLVVKIPDDVIEDLNKQKNLFPHYKIELTPII